jgi:hypothetical protein
LPSVKGNRTSRGVRSRKPPHTARRNTTAELASGKRVGCKDLSFQFICGK